MSCSVRGFRVYVLPRNLQMIDAGMNRVRPQNLIKLGKTLTVEEKSSAANSVEFALPSNNEEIGYDPKSFYIYVLYFCWRDT